jgi:hypothetical protein
MDSLLSRPGLLGQPVGNNARPARRLGARVLIAVCFLFLPTVIAHALERPGTVFPIFQFPANAIPRIDGDASDWAIVPESYVIGTDQLQDTSGRHASPQPHSLDVRVKVGWVKGENRLYFLYEACDDYWEFAEPGLRNDTFELVVDGDLSGGPLVAKYRLNAEVRTETEAYFAMQGVHAQNYHIFTPHQDKNWAMFWGPQQWLKELPYANAAQAYSFRPGEGGKYLLEFFITPFDHASPLGPTHSNATDLRENGLIGMGWAIIDYDRGEKRNNGFWNLSPKHTMFGKADELLAFRLMPLDDPSLPKLQAAWNLQIVDHERRIVAFKDKSFGPIETWNWDFGDGQGSSEQHPIHKYDKAGRYVVILVVHGPQGSSRFSRVWDVTFP